MKIIDSTAAYRMYNQYNAPAAPSAEQGQQGGTVAAAPQKTDTISLSGQATRNEGLGRLTQNIASELSTGVSASRLQGLKTAVENGEYYVPTARLANAMLNISG